LTTNMINIHMSSNYNRKNRGTRPPRRTMRARFKS